MVNFNLTRVKVHLKPHRTLYTLQSLLQSAEENLKVARRHCQVSGVSTTLLFVAYTYPPASDSVRGLIAAAHCRLQFAYDSALAFGAGRTHCS